MRLGWAIVLFVLVVMPASTAMSDSRHANDRFLTVYGPATAPFGYRAFCDRHRLDCVLPSQRKRIDLTSQRWDDLETINLIVNRTVTPISDADLYGSAEVWAYPGRAGDCEDYVLLKRRMLMKRGWPASALLITVVRDEFGEGHAVLTARTTSGDLILDNRLDDVVAWHALPYEFIKRQSSVNPMSWVALTPVNDGVITKLGTTKGRISTRR